MSDKRKPLKKKKEADKPVAAPVVAAPASNPRPKK